MKFSELWLREWVKPAIDTEALVAQITMAGLEVDGVESVAGDFTGVVVGHVQSVEPHPDADKLNVCQVSDGQDTFQVVCGASNVKSGIKVPFAKLEAVLPGNFRIKKAKLRGVESFGMLCAESELGLAEQSDGLMILAEDAPTGSCIRSYLGLDDKCIEVDLTPNRSDCLSIAGLAREVGVLNKVPVSEPEILSVPNAHNETFTVEIHNPQACPKYLGRVIKGVDLRRPSPLWLQEKLRRCGLRSIDAVVDVTNYVLLEFGQPMHAFDLAELKGAIRVRNANNGEQLTLLDGQVISLRDDTLIIADEAGPLAIAGVMGGEHSGVTEKTQNVFLECAFFAPLSLAGKARSYGLHTDSSHRFERGVDYQLQHKVMERATALLLDIVGGEAGPITEQVSTEHLPQRQTVSLRKSRVGALLGLQVADAEIEDILTRLGLKIVATDSSGWTFEIPSYRFDIAIEPDLIEEIGRIYGYDKLPKTSALGEIVLKADDESSVSESFLADRLVSLGYQEAITYSFVDQKLQELVNPEQSGIALANPISADLAVMRTSLWPGLLKALSYNQNRQQTRVKLFETGLKFEKVGDQIKQTPMLAGLAAGTVQPENWNAPARKLDFYDVKADVERLLLCVDNKIRFEKAEHAALHPGQSAKIVKNEQVIGYLGAIHPKLQKFMDLNGPVYLFELCLIEAIKGSIPRFSEVSRYPEVRRDLAIVIDQQIPFEAVRTQVVAHAGPDLVNVVLFDVYAGENLGEGLRSLGLALFWQRTDRTLNDEEINKAFESIVSALNDKFGAKLRS
jgi:phenylalanyl-tRNA synthetase beta chain